MDGPGDGVRFDVVNVKGIAPYENLLDDDAVDGEGLREGRAAAAATAKGLVVDLKLLLPTASLGPKSNCCCCCPPNGVIEFFLDDDDTIPPPPPPVLLLDDRLELEAEDDAKVVICEGGGELVLS